MKTQACDVYRSKVESALLYGGEMWPLTEKLQSIFDYFMKTSSGDKEE
jgi:hypothetical protein